MYHLLNLLGFLGFLSLPGLVAPQGTCQASYGSSFGALADADGTAAHLSAELTLPALVSGSAAVRSAASEAKKQLQQRLGSGVEGEVYWDAEII